MPLAEGSGVYVPPKPPKPSGGGGYDPGGSGEHGASGGGVPKTSWVISRQRLLRALGYPVRVDGIWGPISQSYWSRYLGAGGSSLTTLRNTNQVARVQRRINRARRQVNLAQRRITEQQQMLALNRRAAVDRVKQDKMANRVERNLAPDRMDDYEVEREKRLAPLRALRASSEHGRTATRAYSILRRHPSASRSMSITEFANYMLDPSVNFDPTDRADVTIMQRFLQLHGHPNVRVDGNWSKQVNDAFVDDWERARAREIRERKQALVESFYDSDVLQAGAPTPWWWPVSGDTPTPGELLRMLNRGGFTAAIIFRELVRQWQSPTAQFAYWRSQEIDRLVNALGRDPSLPGGVFGQALTGGLTEGQKVMRISAQAQWLRPQDVIVLNAQLSSLFNSSTMPEFRRKIVTYQNLEEAAFIAKQREDAKDPGFWGWVGDTLTRPGNWARPRFMALETWLQVHAPFGATDEERVKKAGGYLAFANKTLEDMPTWQRIVVELSVDPINFIPFGTLGKIGRVSTYGAGARLVEAGASHESELLTLLGGGLIKTSEIQPFRLLGRGAANGLRSLPHGDYYAARIERAVSMATRLKTDALEAASGRVQLAMRNGFIHAEERGVGLGKGYSTASKILLEETAHRLDTVISDVFKTTLSPMYESRVSLYVDEARRSMSIVGQALRQRTFEELRVQHVQAISREYASERFFASLGGKSVKDATPEELSVAELAREEEYVRVKRSFGAHAKGSGLDPNNIDDPTELLAQLDARVYHDIDRFENVLLPAMQDNLLAAADNGGYSLFDESKLWMGRNDELATSLRKELREGFDAESLVPIPNPAYNIPIPYATARKLMDGEINRVQARYMNYVDRSIAEGKEFPKPVIRSNMKRLRDEVEDAWESTPAGYRDTRPTIKVSKIYARHLSLGDDILKNEIRDFARAGDLPPQVAGGIDGELSDVAWMLRGAQAVANRDLALDPAMRYSFQNAAKYSPAKEQIRFEFLEALTNREVALSRAADEVMPYALKAEFAFMQALNSAQSKPLRVIEKGMTGALNGWIFVTLPLRPGWVARNVVDNVTKSMLHGVVDPRAYFANFSSNVGKGVITLADMGLMEIRHMTHYLDELMGTNAGKYIDAAYDTFWQHDVEVLRKIFDSHLMPIDEEHLMQIRQVAFSSARPASASERHATDSLNDLLQERLAGERALSREIGEEAGEMSMRDFEYIVESLHLPSLDAMPAGVVERSKKALVLREKRARSKARMLDEGKSEVEASRLSRVENLNRYEQMKDKIWYFMATKPENFQKKAVYRDTWFKERNRMIAAKTHVTSAGEADIGRIEYEATALAWQKVEKLLFDYSKVSVTEDNFRIFFPFIQFWRKNTVLWASIAARNPAVPYELTHFDKLRDELHADLPEALRRYMKIQLPFSDATARVPGLRWLADYVSNADVYADPLNFFSFAPMYRAFKQSNPNLAPEDKGWKFISGFIEGIEDFGLGLNPMVSQPLRDMGIANFRAWQQVLPLTTPAAALSRRFLSERWAKRLIDFDQWLGDPILRSLGVGRRASEELAENFDYYVRQEMVAQAARGEEVSRVRAERRMQDWFLMQNLLGYFSGVYVRRISPQDRYLQSLYQANYEDLSPREKELLRLQRLARGDRLAFDRYLEIQPLIQAFYGQPSYEAAQKFKQDHPEILPYVESIYRGRPYSSEGLRDMHLQLDTESAIRLFRLVDTLDLDEDTTSLATRAMVTPELRDYWALNDTPGEIRTRMMRGEYFRYLNGLNQTYFAIPEDDFESKQEFLAMNPTLQRYWTANDSRSDSYKAIINGANADLRETYFELIEREGFDGAADFLHKFPFIFEFTRAAGRVDAQGNWLGSGSQEGGARGMTQHAADYLAAKSYLDFYFSLDESARSAWLNSGNPGAQVVQDYFKKYSSFHDQTRRFSDFADFAVSSVRSAELRRRLIFWQRYFALTPDKRPAFVKNHSAEYGIYVFGIFGERERAQKRAEWMRSAISHGATARAAAYMWIKPLLDFFFTLKKDQRSLFVKANPELEWYFDNYTDQSPSGDAGLDKLLDQYFNLPEGSDERSLMLQQHPEIQDFFDEKSTPAERALHNLLEVYFAIPVGKARKEFLTKHPEIQIYFNRKAAEKDAEAFQLRPFEQADPRMQAFLRGGEYQMTAAERQRQKLAAGKESANELTVRTEREPL